MWQLDHFPPAIGRAVHDVRAINRHQNIGYAAAALPRLVAVLAQPRPTHWALDRGQHSANVTRRVFMDFLWVVHVVHALPYCFSYAVA